MSRMSEDEALPRDAGRLEFNEADNPGHGTN